MTTFSPTLEEFKQATAEFCKAAPSCDRGSLDNGYKALALLYFGLPDDPLTALMGESHIRFAGRRYVERDVALSQGEG